MPTLRTGIRRSSLSGFTIIELMIVLVIIALMSGVAVMAMGPALRDARLRSACRVVASTLNYARSYAVSKCVETRVLFVNGRAISVVTVDKDTDGTESYKSVTTSAGATQTLAEGVEVAGIVKVNSEEAENEDWVAFSKLGQADQAIIELIDKTGEKRYVVLNPITGRCKVMSQDDMEQEATSD